MCPKSLKCKIFKDNMLAWKDEKSKREHCIAMTDTVQPQLNCQFEVMNDENFGSGKYALVKIDKKTYRCLTPKPAAETPEEFRFKKKKMSLKKTFKKDDEAKDEVCDPMELPIFNITNPHMCLPCGASG